MRITPDRRAFLTSVVKYDNMPKEGTNSGRADDQKDTAGFMDQGCAEGIRDVPGRRQVDLSCRFNYRGGRRQGRCCGLGPGVFEVALPFQSDAFRVVYAVQLADEIWVVHAFRKNSTQSIKPPQPEIDLIKDRLKRLKEILQ